MIPAMGLHYVPRQAAKQTRRRMLRVCTCPIAQRGFSQILSRTSFKIRLRVGSEHTHESEVCKRQPNALKKYGRLFYAIFSTEVLEVCFCNACVQAGLQHAYLAHVEVRVTVTYVPQPEPKQPPCYGLWVCACLCPCLCLYFVCLCICRMCSKISILLLYHPLPCIARVLWTPWQEERAVANAGSCWTQWPVVQL